MVSGLFKQKLSCDEKRKTWHEINVYQREKAQLLGCWPKNNRPFPRKIQGKNP